MTKQYCLDTSSLVTPWKNSPIDLFPDMWSKIYQMFLYNKLIVPSAMYDELKKVDDDLFKLVKNYKGNCVQEVNESIFNIYLDLEAKYPSLSSKGASENDLFIIATAKHLGLTLVTEEAYQRVRKDSNQDTKKMNYKIPRICRIEGIKFCRLIHLFS